MSVVDDQGYTALHQSAQRGRPDVTKLLAKAGAPLDAKLPNSGFTPLDLAAEQGHSEVVGVLIEAGANPNSRGLRGTTALFLAANRGHVDVIKMLLRAKADPLLTFTSSGGALVPLDVAAQMGRLEVVRELIQECGIEGCGGASGGGNALQTAAHSQHVEVMGMLTCAGVVDTGAALLAAVMYGGEASVKFLLQQRTRNSSGQGAAYLDTFEPSGRTPLVCSIEHCHSCSPRIIRMLVDAGADTTMAVRLLDEPGGTGFFDGTPLALTNLKIREKKIEGKDATEGQLHTLAAIRRLLMRVRAVHAVSWLWPSEIPSTTHAAAEGKMKTTKATPSPLITMLPIFRRRAGRSRLLLAALFRNSKKP